MTTTRDPANPVWKLLQILRSDLRPADLSDACASELAELQEQLDHWGGVVGAFRRDSERLAFALKQANAKAAARLDDAWPDALERPAQDGGA